MALEFSNESRAVSVRHVLGFLALSVIRENPIWIFTETASVRLTLEPQVQVLERVETCVCQTRASFPSILWQQRKSQIRDPRLITQSLTSSPPP